MPKSPDKPDPKSVPGLVTIRLQLTPAERDEFRSRAAKTPARSMAVLARSLVRDYLSTPAKED